MNYTGARVARFDFLPKDEMSCRSEPRYKTSSNDISRAMLVAESEVEKACKSFSAA